MRKASGIILLAAMLAGCGRRGAPAPQAAAGPEPQPERVTLWSPRTELFLEYPPLVAGKVSRFAIHLTRLDNFKPATSGRCQVQVSYASGGAGTFSTDGPSRPGIFGVDVRPSRAGKVLIRIQLTNASLTDAHLIEDVTVWADERSAVRQHAEESEETISFLKEQQWTLDFATQVVEARGMRESLLAPAEVLPRSGGEAEVTAAVEGRILAGNLPGIGASVAKGEVLARILPPTPSPNDLALLDLAQAEALTSLEQARRDRQRAQRLVEAGAAPARRLEEARALEATLLARLKAAEARLKQYAATRNAEGDDPAAGFAVRAPIGGMITEVRVPANANVPPGQALFKIVDIDRVYVRASVPEAELQRVRALTGAELEIPGLDRTRPAGRLVMMGALVDPAARTFPVIFEAANSDRRLAINQTLSVRLFLSASRQAAAVPESALVDDGGRPVVFLQKEGESFARQPVKTGLRQGGYVEILEGVRTGDRVVTRGAYLIRLSSLSSQIPAQGHVH
ncbi:MAG: efflux RND transporter periplasmic adaptor subunit [Acidobacteriota bacterium]